MVASDRCASPRFCWLCLIVGDYDLRWGLGCGGGVAQEKLIRTMAERGLRLGRVCQGRTEVRRVSGRSTLTRMHTQAN